ncbi:MAG: hypothetical protein H0T11_04225 [Chthoniobacterales bacterium]|nr:hypothetical protein [Chthoniobacterales bacterium]
MKHRAAVDMPRWREVNARIGVKLVSLTIVEANCVAIARAEPVSAECQGCGCRNRSSVQAYVVTVSVRDKTQRAGFSAVEINLRSRDVEIAIVATDHREL